MLKHVLPKFCLATLLLLQNKQNMDSHFGNNDSDQHVADTCAYKYYGSEKQFEIFFSENHSMLIWTNLDSFAIYI